MGRGDAKNKRKGNKGTEGGEEKRTPSSSNADNATPVTKNPFANMLCALSPYNLPQLRDAEAKYYARIASSKVEFPVFSTIAVVVSQQQTCTAPQLMWLAYIDLHQVTSQIYLKSVQAEAPVAKNEGGSASEEVELKVAFDFV